jgi:hypothetical protein
VQECGGEGQRGEEEGVEPRRGGVFCGERGDEGFLV